MRQLTLSDFDPVSLDLDLECQQEPFIKVLCDMALQYQAFSYNMKVGVL